MDVQEALTRILNAAGDQDVTNDTLESLAQDKYDEGHYAGKEEGDGEGYERGREVGWDLGHDEGYNEGYADGVEAADEMHEDCDCE